MLPNELNTIIANYAPAEAVRWMLHYPDSQQTRGFETSQKVHEFLKTFNMHGYLLIFEAQLLRAPLRAHDRRIHFSYTFQELMSGYRTIQALIHRFAPRLNDIFNAPNFRNDRLGFGYIRPQSEFVPPFTMRFVRLPTGFVYSCCNILTKREVGQNSEEGIEGSTIVINTILDGLREKARRFYPNPIVTIGVDIVSEGSESEISSFSINGNGLSDWRLMDYAKLDNRATATEMARMLIEANVSATPTMLENARADRQTAVVELIEEHIQQQNSANVEARAFSLPAAKK